MKIKHIVTCEGCDYQHVSFDTDFSIDDALDLIWKCENCDIDQCSECENQCSYCGGNYCVDCIDEHKESCDKKEIEE